MKSIWCGMCFGVLHSMIGDSGKDLTLLPGFGIFAARIFAAPIRQDTIPVLARCFDQKLILHTETFDFHRAFVFSKKN